MRRLCGSVVIWAQGLEKLADGFVYDYELRFFFWMLIVIFSKVILPVAFYL